jgi:hypothetical protein
LATALQENKEVVDILNEAIVVKADKTYVDEAIANIPIESDVLIIDCPDGSIISHTFEQIKTAIDNNKVVYVCAYGTNIMPLTYIADDESFIEFNSIRREDVDSQYTTWIDRLIVNNDSSFSIKHEDLFGSISITENELNTLESLLI